ncbi:MAG: non-canonical purine NTP pyrophosphatase [Patescibacteria group bacterium]
MLKIIIGTKNPAKFGQVQGALGPLELEIAKPDRDLPEVLEDGATIQDNARKKALIYARHLNAKVLSMDNALYLEGLPDDLQPGQNVRRIKGRTDRPSDEEVLEYYQDLIARHGGEISGRWEYAICLANPDGSYQETTVSRNGIFKDRLSDQRTDGYPLESLNIDPLSGRYIADLDPLEKEVFWQTGIGVPLQKFIKQALGLD